MQQDQATNKTPPSITSSESKSVGRRIVHARSLHARKYQSSAIGSGNSSPTGPFGKHIVDSIGQALRGVIDFVYAAQDLESPPTRFYCPSEYEGIGASQVPTDSPKDETFLHRVGFLRKCTILLILMFWSISLTVLSKRILRNLRLPSRSRYLVERLRFSIRRQLFVQPTCISVRYSCR